MLIYQWIVLCGLLWVLGSLLVNLAFFRSLKPVPKPVGGPKVSVLVPARNEEKRLGSCLASLSSQDYPNLELLVLDDHSEDQTSAVARAHGFREENATRRLLHGDELPEGWTGKGWACHQLAKHATGEFLFFTDADTAHAPGTISAAVDMAEKTRASLLSAWPRLRTLTWSERLILPMIHLLAAAMYPHAMIVFFQSHPRLATWLPRPLRRSMGAANGQFIFFRRSAYDLVGGHESVRDHLVEDVALGRAVSERMNDGLRLVNCDASQMCEVRMYTCFNEVWEGFTKNLRAAFEGSLGAFIATGIFQICCFLAPFVFVFLPLHGQGIALIQVGVIYLIRVILSIRYRTSWLGCMLHPFGHALAIAIALNSWRQTARGGVTWKGRRYAG